MRLSARDRSSGLATAAVCSYCKAMGINTEGGILSLKRALALNRSRVARHGRGAVSVLLPITVWLPCECYRHRADLSACRWRCLVVPSENILVRLACVSWHAYNSHSADPRPHMCEKWFGDNAGRCAGRTPPSSRANIWRLVDAGRACGQVVLYGSERRYGARYVECQFPNLCYAKK